MRRLTVRTLFLLVGTAMAINPSDLKPCFERYDGFKIIEALPFHSEWRMRSEEMCLEFCVRSASRCESIVYDKYSHICHYFNVNAIEAELVVKNPRMVYFQTAERECLDQKLVRIISEETQKRMALEEIQKMRAHKAITTPLPTEAATDSTTPTTTTTTVSVGSESTDGNDESVLALDADFDGDPMNFVKLVEEDDAKRNAQRLQVSSTPTTPTTSSSSTTTEEPTTTSATTPSTTTTTPPTTTHTTRAPETSKATQPTTRSPQTSATAKIVEPKLTKTEDQPDVPPSFPIPVDNKIDDMIPVMSGFKMQKKELPGLVEEMVDKKEVEVEVRRHPGQRRPVAKTYVDDEVPVPLPNIYNANCKPGAHEIWVAVENSQVDSGVKSSALKLASQPGDCADTCKTLQVGGHDCDSFTFLESSKRCIFHATPVQFGVKPAFSNDFSTRAFRKFCYPEELSPFEDCAEFLAFRDYSLELEPKEVFEGLPANNDGIAACIELCVLSTEFRCKSATFDQSTGMCMLFDEHSLSKPSAFREHQLANQIYFENGCVPASIPIEREAELKQASKTERIQPIKLDYRTITKH